MNKRLLILSLPYLMSLVIGNGANAALRTSNQSRSYAGSYQQVMALQQQAEYLNQQAGITPIEDLPVRVASNELAERIVRGDTSTGVSMTNLESCARIYPSGSFLWDIPTGGHRITTPATCVAVVELRQYVDGINDTVLARANIASGDGINCNISDFPDATYMPAVGDVLFPADREPTIDDVIKVMNNEQKKNAGFKIAAGAVIGGVGGHLSSSKSATTGKKDATGAVVGVLTGAGIGAGSSYAGKVGGDMILSAGVNAAAGGVIGNMVGGGDSVLRIEDCIIDNRNTKCLWGILEKNEPLNPEKEVGFYNVSEGRTAVCQIKEGKFVNCTDTRLIGMVLEDYKTLEEGLTNRFANLKNKYTLNSDSKEKIMELGVNATNAEGIWAIATSAGRPKSSVAAMIPDFRDSTFGKKMTDWYKWRSTAYNIATNKPVGRTNKGEYTELPKDQNWTIQDFYPLTIDADDGGIIDVGNKARLKGTLVGAGAGAGLGAFTAYQGAQDEIDMRWVSAVQEYKDSLQKFYCATGKRFLSQYNDAIIIPNMSE